MNDKTINFLDQIIEDSERLRKVMRFEDSPFALSTISAFLFANAGKRADVYKYVTCRDYLKRSVSVFSGLRGIARSILITKMCIVEDYDEYLTGVAEIYKKLSKAHKLAESAYMVMTAINIYEGGGRENAAVNIEKMENVYKEMKSGHFWLAGEADRPLIAMMISRNLDISAIASEISRCYEACKKMSLSKSAMYSTAQIMALSDKSIDEKVTDLDYTINALKRHNLKGMKSDLMSMAAILGFIDAKAEDKAADIKEIHDYMKNRRWFKWYVSGTERSKYAILAYMIDNIDGENIALNSVIKTTLTEIIIDEMILLNYVVATTTANGQGIYF